MANNIISIAKLFIDGRQTGNKQLEKVESFTVTDDRDKEVVKAIGIKRGAGTRKSPGGGTIELKVYREKGTPEVDWQKAAEEDWEFAFTRQDEGGGRYQYRGVEVANVTEETEIDSNMFSVKCTFLDSGPVPSAV